MNTEDQMTTFEIKMTILTIMGQSANLQEAEKLYDWIMQELKVEELPKGSVSHLKTVN